MDIASLGMKIESHEAQLASQRLDSMTKAGAGAESAMGRLGSASSNAASQLAAVAGVTLSIAGAFYAAERAVSSWYSMVSRGIGIVDDYKKQIIGTSYILSTMSEVKPVDLSKAYGQWKDYFGWLYQQALEADKKSAASAQEIFGVSVELAKKGVIAASQEEMDTIGRLTDLMKAVTPTYASLEQQARGEIEAMMSGTIRLGAQTAIILQQIDPAFKKNIASAREQGTVLEYVRSILPQIRQYTLDLMGTWDAVGASLKSAWQVINLKAFGDAHREVVGFAQELSNKLVQNGELTEQGVHLADALGAAWASAKGKVADLLDYVINNAPTVIKDVETIASAVGTIAGAAFSAAKGVSQMVNELSQAAQNPIVGALLGGAAGSRLGPWGALGGAVLGFRSSVHLGTAREKAGEFEGYEMPGESLRRAWSPLGTTAPPTPGVRPFTGKGAGDDGGGKGIEAAERQLENFVNRMKELSAKAAGESFTALEEWYGKETTAIQRLEQRLGVSYEAREALDAAYQFKRKGLIDKFSESEMKRFEESAHKQEKMWMDSIELQQNQYEQLAQISPALQDQIRFKERALELEIQIKNVVFERKMLELEKGGFLSPEQKDEAKRMNALINQAKKFDLEWQKISKHANVFNQLFQDIGSSFRTMATGIIMGTMSIGEGIAGFMQGISNSILNAIFTMLANWAMAKVMMLGLNYAASVGIITNEAAVAGAKAYAAYADIPFIGLALGAAAAAAVMGIMLAFQGNLKSSAMGDFRVAETGLRMVHKEETILPSWAAEGWREIVTEGKSNKGGPGENGVIINLGGITYAPAYRASEAERRSDLKALMKEIGRHFGNHGLKFAPGRI